MKQSTIGQTADSPTWLVHTLFHHVPDKTIVQLFRFGMAGGVALVVDCSLLLTAVSVLGWNHVLGASLGYLAGLVVNYVISVRWVFAKRRYADQRVEFLLFLAIGLSGLVLTDLVFLAGTDWGGLDYRLSKLIALVGVAGWNFSLRKLWLFSDRTVLRRKVPTSC